MAETVEHISVVELDFHHDSLDGFLKIFENTPVRVSAFTTAENLCLLQQVNYAGNITFYPFRGGSKYLFLRKHRAVLRRSQIVFVNTIANDFGAYLALDRNLTTVLRVHNVNKQFRPWQNLVRPASPYFAWKFFSYTVRQIVFKGFWLFRPLVNARMRYFTFPDAGITAHVRQLGVVPPEKLLPPIPLKIFRHSDTAFAPFSSVLNLTVIGATDARRRDYAVLCEALKRHFSGPNPVPVHLTLLGNCNNPYGRQVLDNLTRIAHAGFSLRSYNAQVPEQEFLERIQQTHLIVSPITDAASTDVFREVYGETKTTGSILDFLKFGKTTLVPAHYQAPQELQRFIIPYTDAAGLAQQLGQLTSGTQLNELNRSSLEHVQKNYSQAVVFKNTLSIFTPIACQ